MPDGVYPRVVPDPRTITLAVRGPIGAADRPGLAARVCAVLRRNPGAVVLCELTGVGPDAATVDALARLQLVARRYGGTVRLRNASAELLELVDLMGLHDALVG